MNKGMQYETPEIIITKFEIEKIVMAETDFGGDAGNGQEVESALPSNSDINVGDDFWDN